jgi:hypothetical protein
VRQHHALGVAGGAGGVDDGGQVIGTDPPDALPETRTGVPGGAGSEDLLEGQSARRRRPLDLHHVLEAGAVAAHADQHRRVFGAVRHNHAAAGVAHLKRDLGGGEGGVHGHVHGAQIQHREVHHVPLRAVLRHQHHPVAPLHTEPREALGQGRRVLKQLAGREPPHLAGAVEGTVAVLLHRHVAPEDFDDGALAHGHLASIPEPRPP